MKVLLVIFHITFTVASQSILQASMLKACHLNDPRRDQCISKTIEYVIRTLLSESPSNLDLPIIDPFTMDFASLVFGNEMIGYECVSNVTGSRLLGLRRMKIRSLQSEFKRNRVTVKAEVFLAKLFNTGNYSFVLRATHFPFRLASRGSLNFTTRDTHAKWLVKGKLENVDGEDYLKIYRFDIDPDANHFEMYFSDDLINQFGDNFINRYWRLFYKDLFKSSKPFILEMINQIFAKIPFRYLLAKD